MKRVKCHICGYYTFEEGLGLTFDICHVCFWEDDIFDYDGPDADTGANCVSLQEARENYLKIGAILPNNTRDKLRDFFRENPSYQKRIESRIASYWDLFYKNAYPDFKKYVRPPKKSETT